MSRKRIGNNSNDDGGSPGWITTFSDLMSLLLTFFILLYSTANVDEEKFQQISGSIQNVLSGVGGGGILEYYRTVPEVIDDDVLDMLNKEGIQDGILGMHNKVLDYVTNEDMDKEVTVNMNKRGVFVDIKEAILFDPGSAKIKDGGLDVLEKLEPLLNEFENDIVIEGYTDDVPMNSTIYPSNWELSTARAVAVLRDLSETRGINPERLSAVGYGEYKPIVANDSAENRAANRRVNILIIFEEESGGRDIEELE